MRSSAGNLGRLSAGLGGTLFPDSPEPGHRLGRAESGIVVASVLAMLVFLQLLRLGLSDSLESFWAEDATVFFGGAQVEGFWESLVSPYTNYLVVLPRLIGETATWVPLEVAPSAVAILATTAGAVSALAVWHASAGHIHDPYLRAALAAATALAPVAGLETINSGSYASWYMMVAVFWLLLWRPRTGWGAGLAAVFILVTALSNATVWFLIPLAALRTVAIRDTRDVAIIASFWIGAVVQVPVALTHEQMADPTWSADIWTAYLQRILGGALLGLDIGGSAWSEIGWPYLWALLAAALVGLSLGLRRAGTGPRALAALSVLTSVAMFAAICYQRDVGTTIVWEAGDYSGAVSRYAIVPALLLLGAALALLDSHLRDRRGRRGSGAAVAAAVAIVVVAIATSFDQAESEVRGTPPWSAALEEAAVACAAEDADSVPAATSPPGFGVFVPCDKIPEDLRPETSR
jgi:hypothetical protein